MSLGVRVLQELVVAGFVLLGVVAVRDWARFRGRSPRAQALAFGSLGVLALTWLANDLSGFTSRTLSEIAVVAFAASGYGLLSIRHALVPLDPSSLRLARAATIAAIGFHAIVSPPLGLRVRYSVLDVVALWMLVGVWAASAGEPVFTLWRQARSLPAVQRARLRTLSLGIAVLVLVLLAYSSVAPRGGQAARALWIEGTALVLLPLLWFAFSPPPSLRRVWRVQEEEALWRAFQQLLLGARDRATFARLSLAWAVRLVGADGGYIEESGERLASIGDPPAIEDDAELGRRKARQAETYNLTLPIETAGGGGKVVVYGGRFAPVFGSDERNRLKQWAAAAGIAFDRIRIVGELADETQKKERILQAMSDLGEGVVIGNPSRLVYVNDAYCAMVGYSRDEILAMSPLDLVKTEDRSIAIDNARRRRSGLPAPVRYDLHLVRKDGALVDVEVAVKPYDIGGPGHFIGVFRNITSRKRTERALRESEARQRTVSEALAREAGFVRLLQDVAVAANEATEIEEALKLAVDLICDRTGWPIGHAYLVDDDGEALVPTTVWHVASGVDAARFRAAGDQTRMARGVGLPGKVLEEGRPVWVEDVARDRETLSVRFADEATVRAGFAFPVLTGKDVAAVLEFFAAHPVPLDSQLLDVVGHIGQQLGRVAERVRARRELEEREGKLHDAQAIAHVGSWEWDMASNTVTWSEELYRMFGLNKSTFAASFEGFLIHVHPDDRERVRRSVEEAAADHRPFSFDHRIVRPDGTQRTLNGRGQVILDGRGRALRMVGTGQDVTEQRRAEEALRSAYEREREALDRLRKLDEMKSSILSAVSHELRTPLTVILGFAETMIREGVALSEEDRGAFLKRIAGNAQKLDRLLSDLLDLDRMDRGILQPRRRPTDVPALLRRMVEQSGVAEHRRITVTSPEFTVAIDAPRAERILENLLVNADRHTPSHSQVWVRAEPRQGGALLVVEDEGPGVPAEQRALIFEPFRQGPGAPSHSPGVGIGLSLVSRFAAMHGGRAWVEERPGGGASFRVFLPGGRDADDPAQPRTAAGPVAMLDGDVKVG
jgi:PAS domain S-box-containing protein